jgi:hypothetical protein
MGYDQVVAKLPVQADFNRPGAECGQLSAGLLWLLLGGWALHADLVTVQGHSGDLRRACEELSPAALLAMLAVVLPLASYLLGSLSVRAFSWILPMLAEWEGVLGADKRRLVLMTRVSNIRSMNTDFRDEAIRKEIDAAGELREQMEFRSAVLPPVVAVLLYAPMGDSWSWVVGPLVALPFVLDAWRIGQASRDADRLVEELAKTVSSSDACAPRHCDWTVPTGVGAEHDRYPRQQRWGSA